MEGDIKTNNQTTPIVGAILVVGLMITGAILLKGGGNTGTSIKGNTTQQEENGLTPLPRAVSQNEHILGDPNAKVIVVEYSDTDCPYCKAFHDTMHQVVNQSGGKVAWVYRHYPIPQLHPNAPYEAEATECAWEQGGNEGFWNFVDETFAKTKEEPGKIAASLGLDMAKFNECLVSGKYESKVGADVADGKKAGVRGTPTSFILVDGEVVDMINGAASLETVLAQIYAAENN